MLGLNTALKILRRLIIPSSFFSDSNDMKLEITNRRENFHIYVKIIQHNSKQFTDQKKCLKRYTFRQMKLETLQSKIYEMQQMHF